MVVLRIVDGDLIDSDEPIIAYTFNYAAQSLMGLSAQIFQKHPYADIRRDMLGQPSPPDNLFNGCIQFRYPRASLPSAGSPIVVTMYNSSLLKSDLQLRFFEESLNKIVSKNIDHIAMQYEEVCSSIGGEWEHYEEILTGTPLLVSLYRKRHQY
jgi:hypothetical protein